MKNQKLVTKEEFIELLKNNNIPEYLVNKYFELPDSIIIDKYEYNINNLVCFNDDSSEILETTLNYYCKKNYKFLLPYKTENNLERSVSGLIKEYDKFNNR